jgi:hypothetical protein
MFTRAYPRNRDMTKRKTNLNYKRYRILLKYLPQYIVSKLRSLTKCISLEHEGPPIAGAAKHKLSKYSPTGVGREGTSLAVCSASISPSTGSVCVMVRSEFLRTLFSPMGGGRRRSPFHWCTSPIPQAGSSMVTEILGTSQSASDWDLCSVNAYRFLRLLSYAAISKDCFR